MTAVYIALGVLGVLALWTITATLLGIGVGRLIRSGEGPREGDKQ